jgi:hypothetical protein
VLPLRAREEEERHRLLLGHAEEGFEQLERGLVRPVEVLEDEAERLLLGQLADELVEDLERTRLDRLSVELADALRGIRLEREAEDAGEEGIGLLGVVAEQVRELGLELEAHARLGCRGTDLEPFSEEVSKRPVREGLRVRDAAPLDEADAVSVPAAHLPDEPALADSRLARHGDDRAAPFRERVHRPLEHGQLEVPPDERVGRLDRLVVAQPRDAVGVHRLAQALELLAAQLFDIETGLDLTVRRRSDEHAPLAGDLLEPSCEVDGLAERVPGVVAVLPVLALAADDHGACVDPYADGEVDAVGVLDLLAVLGDRALDGECRPDGPLGVVLVGDGCSEEGEELVTLELRDGAVEAADLLAHDPHDLVDQQLGALGAELLADRRRADDVRDQRGDDPAFACRYDHVGVIAMRAPPAIRPRRSKPGGRVRRCRARAEWLRAAPGRRARRGPPRAAAPPPRRRCRAGPAPA